MVSLPYVSGSYVWDAPRLQTEHLDFNGINIFTTFENNLSLKYAWLPWVCGTLIIHSNSCGMFVIEMSFDSHNTTSSSEKNRI